MTASKPHKTYKVCGTCGEEKSLSCFYNNKAAKDGKTSKCKVCSKEYSKRYKAENKDSVEEYSKSYRKEYYRINREKKLAWQKNYRAENLDARREYDREQSKRHYQENKDMYLEKGARRRSRKLQATPPWLDDAHKKRLRSIYRACQNVTDKSGKKHHVDHIIPLKGENVCGLHVWWNLRIIPAEMNLAKGNALDLP